MGTKEENRSYIWLFFTEIKSLGLAIFCQSLICSLRQSFAKTSTIKQVL